jgi:hypothetical protein
MPSSLPKYSGLISEHQLSILSEFIALHDGISKARVLGRLLEAWQDAGKPILGDRNATMLDLALQFEQLDLDAVVAQKVQEYLDIHLNSLVKDLVENKLRPISNIDKREIIIDENLVKNQLLTNYLEEDENLAQGNITDKGELKVVIDKDKDEKEVVSLPVQGDREQRLGDKQKGESDQVSNKGIDQVDDLNKEDSNKDIDQVNDLSKEDSNEDIDRVNDLSKEDSNKDIDQVDDLNKEDSNEDSNKDIDQVDDLSKGDSNKDIDQVNDLSKEDSNKGIDQVNNLNEKDDNKDTNQVEKISEEDISPTEQGHNLVSNKVRNKVIENDEGKQDVKDSSTPTIMEENPASQLVITLDESEVNNEADVSHIPADFLALPQGKVETKILAQILGLSSSARVS